MKCRINQMKVDFEDLRQGRITLLVDRRHLAELPTDTDKPLTVEIEKEKKKRSLSANAYCWVLAEQIAKKLGLSKEQVYKQAISQVGVSQTYTMKAEAAERFKQVWSANGIGWEVIVMPLSGGNCDVIAYIGSSRYYRDEMARLIDWLVEEAEGLQIDVRTPAERSLMLEEWERV